MFSEQFFDLLLNFGDDWKVDDVKVNFKLEEVDIYVSYISDNAECPDSMELCSIYDHRNIRRWRHLDTMQFKTFINCSYQLLFPASFHVTTCPDKFKLLLSTMFSVVETASNFNSPFAA